MIQPIFHHISLLFQLKHDGKGLPQTSGAIAFILGLSVLCTLIWATAAGDQVVPDRPMMPIVLFSIGILLALVFVSPTLGVVSALVGMPVDLAIAGAAFFGEAATAQTVGELIQVFVIVHFWLNRNKPRGKK